MSCPEQRATMGTSAVLQRPERSLRLHHREPIVVVELIDVQLLSWICRVFITLVLSTSVLLSVRDIGKPRKPVTPETAVGIVLFGALLILAVWAI